MVDILIIIVQGIVFISILLYIYLDSKDRQSNNLSNGKQVEDIASTYIIEIAKVYKQAIEDIRKLDEKHFKQLDTSSVKQIALIDKQYQKALLTIERVVETMTPKPPEIPSPHLLDNFAKIENTIEKEELPEQELDEVERIPMIKNGNLNVQFEGEEQILPIQID